MRYENICQAIFLDRPNRFIAHVDIKGTIETVHVKNTGRCRELLIPGKPVILSGPFDNGRKTRYDLIAAQKDHLGWVNIDSQLPNALVFDWLKNKPFPFTDVTMIRPEYSWGRSRFDFMLQNANQKILLQVKGCTLEQHRIGYFPDAPTERGKKHLKELIQATREGWQCYIAFVITMPGVAHVLPNRDTDPAFAETLTQALEAGIQMLELPCHVTPNEVRIL